MSTGIYGTIRAANVAINDIEVLYTYSPDLTSQPNVVQRLNSTEVLEEYIDPNNPSSVLGGLYNLNLPTSIFNAVGYYNVYIRPVRIKTRILDCGILQNNSDVKGLVFDLQDIPSEYRNKFENNGLIGYRIEYFDISGSGNKIRNLTKIITSNNRVEPLSDNSNSNNQKSIKYRFNNNSSLVFCTLTPSSAPITNPNVFPFIGIPQQSVEIINTFFDEQVIQIEIAEHDFDTLATGIFGDQTFNVLNGLRTYYNSDGEIYKQFNEKTIKDENSESALYDVKKERDNIDFSEDIENISNFDE